MYTVITVTLYTVNDRTLPQRLIRYRGNSAELFERMTYLCTPVNATIERTENTVIITSKE